MKFFKNIIDRFAGKPVDWDELEESLIRSDIGVPMTLRIIQRLQERGAQSRITANDIGEIAREEIGRVLPINPPPIRPLPAHPKVILIVGVNGTGKTTTAAKLAWKLQKEGRKVLLAAADTYRAGAVAQLQIWANRLGLPCVAGAPGGDPASVAFDAIDAASSRGLDTVIVDTAGRLHTQEGLMDELRKITRVVGRRLPGAPHETLLVLDGTVGQNAVQQGRLFAEAVSPTGLIVTKLDGSARGGAVAALRRELDLPIRFIGLGESVEDLEPFDPERFAENLLAEAPVPAS